MKELDEIVEGEIGDKLFDFFSNMENDRIIVFDTETGGVEATSPVLSISAIMLRIDKYKELIEVDRFNRFYYPHPSKPTHPKAIEVNGLTDDMIESLRGRARYAEYFDDETEFYEWCRGCYAYVGHNIQFDMKYVPELDARAVFDTMHSNVNYVKAEWNDYRNQWKWPKLSETCTKYNIVMQEDRLHESIYDVEMTVAIFQSMLKRFTFRMKRLREFEVI